MKYLAKLVAGILMLALCAAPLYAVASCFGGTDCATHCEDCCAGMAKSAKLSGATQAADMVQAMPAQPSQAPCCNVSSGELISPAVPKEIQGSMPSTVSPVASYTPAHLARLSRSSHVLLDRWTGGRAQPVLCTFLI
jgi:hypothetical protein